MTTQKPTLDAAKQIVRAALTEHASAAIQQYGLNQDDEVALQTAVNQMSAHMRGMAAGQRWLAEAIFRALEKDGFVSADEKPSLALYIIEAVLTLGTDGPVIEVEFGGELH